MSGTEHGTASCYKQGCRRDECREADRAYARDYKARRAAPPPAAPPYPDVDGTQPCATTDPELFFPEGKGVQTVGEARRLCEGCEWLRPCLAYALTHTVDGVWGGTSERQRMEIRGKHGIKTVPLHIGAFVDRQRDHHPDTQESA